MDKFLKLSRNNKIQVEYIWTDVNGDLRSKSRTLPIKKYIPDTIPNWDCNGNSTGQSNLNNSEIILKPQLIFRDPFRPDNKNSNLLVLCDTYYPNMKNHISNTRYKAEQIFRKVQKDVPWFGLEQEFYVCQKRQKKGNYYCSVGENDIIHRNLLECHYRACLYAGIKISGVNFEDHYGQLEYQVGPCVGISAGDHLLVSRYILLRLAEIFNIKISFKSNPKEGIKSGCHCNFSTKKMRDKNGYHIILSEIDNLKETHDIDVKKFKRNTGNFTSGIADRTASVRIPRVSLRDQCGYFEDRRPGADIDPYIITSLMVERLL